MVQPWRYEATRIHFVCKENKNNDSPLRLLCVSVAPFWRISAGLRTLFCVSHNTRIRCFHLNQSINNVEDISAWYGWHRRAYAICVQRIFSKMVLRWREETNCWIKSFFFLPCVQKVFSSLFDDVFNTFLGLDSVIYLAVNGTVTNLPVFIQNVLNCAPITGLEWHGGKWLMTTFLFWGGVSL